MSSPKGTVPSKKDHESFLMPKKKSSNRITRSRNKSYQQAMDDTGKPAVQDFIAVETFEKTNQDQKLVTIITSLNKLHTKLDTINNDLYKEKEGVWAKLESAEDNVEKVADDTEMVKFEMAILKGVVQRQEKQIEQLQNKVQDLTVRQMTNNIIISGLKAPKKAKPEDSGKEGQEKQTETVSTSIEIALDFFKSTQGIEVEKEEIMMAHRIGGIDKDDCQQMLVQCTPLLRERILTSSKNLYKKMNAAEKPYFVNQQIPENVLAQKRENAYKIKKIKEENKNKPIKLRTPFKVKNNKLFVEGYPDDKLVVPPQFGDLFADTQEQDKMEKIKMWYSDSKEERGNIFTAVGVKASSLTEVRRAYRRVKQIYSSASHITVGYDCAQNKGNNDDSEFGAGLLVQRLIEDAGAVNRAVFIIRQASGNKLGPRRFAIIAEVANVVLTKIK